ncbi:hypothetical protein DSO57_1015652 [Entomophthora muscae]|uniref:Uncharacterized protein n=1 Tax=Entomophthora muscae TaxID=34485 RepID=A0ACC2TG66_9FUNG|nr:hypothetical protein DSO57_1015652 [Entomophthora muscae]
MQSKVPHPEDASEATNPPQPPGKMVNVSAIISPPLSTSREQPSSRSISPIKSQSEKAHIHPTLNNYQTWWGSVYIGLGHQVSRLLIFIQEWKNFDKNFQETL